MDFRKLKEELEVASEQGDFSMQNDEHLITDSNSFKKQNSSNGRILIKREDVWFSSSSYNNHFQWVTWIGIVLLAFAGGIWLGMTSELISLIDTYIVVLSIGLVICIVGIVAFHLHNEFCVNAGELELMHNPGQTCHRFRANLHRNPFVTCH